MKGLKIPHYSIFIFIKNACNAVYLIVYTNCKKCKYIIYLRVRMAQGMHGSDALVKCDPM